MYLLPALRAQAADSPERATSMASFLPLAHFRGVRGNIYVSSFFFL
jgi:hypothetical protein